MKYVGKVKFASLITVFVFASCVSSPNAQSSTLSNSEFRNVVILGEGGKNPGTVQYYANKYNATVFYKEKKQVVDFYVKPLVVLYAIRFEQVEVYGIWLAN